MTEKSPEFLNNDFIVSQFLKLTYDYRKGSEMAKDKSSKEEPKSPAQVTVADDFFEQEDELENLEKAAASADGLSAEEAADVDQLLFQSDPAFKDKMDSILKEKPSVSKGSALDTNNDSLEDGRQVSKKNKQKISLKILIKTFIHNITQVLIKILLFLKQCLIIKAPLLISIIWATLKVLPKRVSHFFKTIDKFVEHVTTSWQDLQTYKKFIFILWWIIVVLFFGFLQRSSVNRIMSTINDDSFLNNFDSVATEKMTFSNEDKLEEFTSEFRHPEHVVLLKKMNVNLKASRILQNSQSIDQNANNINDENNQNKANDTTAGNATAENATGNDMGIFEFYFEASSEISAVELKDREKEILDLTQRTLEGMRCNELITVKGKQKMKKMIIKAVNSFIGTGQVIRLHIKNMVLKPCS